MWPFISIVCVGWGLVAGREKESGKRRTGIGESVLCDLFSRSFISCQVGVVKEEHCETFCSLSVSDDFNLLFSFKRVSVGRKKSVLSSFIIINFSSTMSY